MRLPLSDKPYPAGHTGSLQPPRPGQPCAYLPHTRPSSHSTDPYALLRMAVARDYLSVPGRQPDRFQIGLAR